MPRQPGPSFWPSAVAAALAAGLIMRAGRPADARGSRAVPVDEARGSAGRRCECPSASATAGPEHAGGTRAVGADRRAAFAAEASAILASSLDYEATLRQVAGLAVPVLADWCTVYMLGEGGQVRRVAVGYVGQTHAELARALSRYPPSPVSPNSSVAEAMRTGEPVLTPVIPDRYVEAIAQDAEHLDIMRRLAFRSSLVVPLVARGETLGALALFSTDPARRYSAQDVALAEDLARRAGLAVDNARLYRDARQAIQARDEFLSVAAHELRTPLTSLVGFAQILRRQLDGVDGPDERVLRRGVEAIDHQSDRLSRLVSRLLDVSRIEDGRLVLEPAVTDLATLVRAIAEAVGVNTGRHEIAVQAPPALWATVDALRIEQVVGNLVDNAIKYSPDGGRIDVELLAGGDRTVRLSVTDSGVGIPPEKRARIFDRFYRAHTDSHTSGLGLGLYISRQIVELHGGSIRAEFPPRGGTRFVVDLPTVPVGVVPEPSPGCDA